MINRIKNVKFHSLVGIPVPEAVAMLGGVVYLIQAILYMHIRLPNLDEGSYLYKGYLLAKGIYSPFQPYGVWLNKMYLSFDIWGWIETLFAPGLLAPRYFAIVFGLLALLGVWIVARRLGNRWLAAIAVLAVALNPTLINIYSSAVSEVLIICMLTWILVLSLGADRPAWQIIAGGALSGIMILTRENMVFMLPLLTIYIFWQHGRKKGALALAAMCIVLLVGHLIYWPDIMQLWIRWLPKIPLPFLAKPARADTGTLALSLLPNLSLAARLHSLSQSIRIHFIPLVGSIIVLLLWPKRDAWPTDAHFRAAVFLAVSFFILLIAHAWASLGQNYCVYCLRDYLAFWGNIGLFLIIVSIQAWNRIPPLISRIALVSLVVIVSSAVGYSLFSYIGAGLLNLPLPRIRAGHILPGWATLWQFLGNKYRIPYADARAYTPAVFGFLIGILLLAIFVTIYHYNSNRKSMALPFFIACSFLFLGMVLLPVLTGPYDEPLCRTDVIASYEELGRQLARIAPPGTKIYLDGTRVDVPLLYISDPKLLLPQLNDTYSHKIGGNPDRLLRDGFWNDEMAISWRDSADVFVIAEDRMPAWKDYFTPDKFEQVTLPPDLFICSTTANIYLFKRR